MLELIDGMDWSGETIPDCVWGLKPEIQAEHDRLHKELQNNGKWDAIFQRHHDINQHMCDHLNKLHALEQQGAFVRGAHCPIRPGDTEIKHWCIICGHFNMGHCEAKGMYNLHTNYYDTCKQFYYYEYSKELINATV